MSSYRYGPTLAGGTVSDLLDQRRQGWVQAGRPGWEKWWLSEPSEVSPELTAMETQNQSGDLLQEKEL